MSAGARVSALPSNETEPTDELTSYLATIPRGLSANQWGRWRAKNRPPYFEWRNRRDGRCGICGGELSAWLKLCASCMEREFAHVRSLTPELRAAPDAPGRDGRVLREEWVDYPEQGPYRPAARRRWFVVRDGVGLEVTRSLKREVAERYL
jgi:hypothetical protein